MRHKILLSLAAALAVAVSSPAVAQDDHRSPAAARKVVEEYYQAIERADYHRAYQLWGGAGKASGKSYAAFRQGFGATAHTRVVTATPVNGDAAMGSVYTDVPVEVFATLKNGRKQHFRGTYTLRRVNDIDGATEAQLHWHIASAKLKAQP